MVIKKLQEKEATLKANEMAKVNETAMYAKRRHRRHSSSSDTSMPDVPHSKGEKRRKARPPRRRPGCFICDSPKHTMRECPHLEKFKAYVKKRKAKDERIKKEEKAKHRHHALVAEDDEHSDTWTSDSDLNDLDEEELAAISKEMVSSIPADSRIADSGASTPMTDNLQLFRGPLKPIRRRVIKVGGGRLCSDKCGLACVRDKKGRTRLITALYVPCLGVDLLSVRRLCVHAR